MAMSAGSLVFGCVPDSDDTTTRRLLDDFVGAVGRQIDRNVAAWIARSPGELAEAFATGQVDFGWVSPTLAVTAAELAKAAPLVRSIRQGVSAFHGVIFVAADSAYKSTLDLRGVRAAWVAPTSASGFIFPRLALAALGLDPRELFGTESFLGTHGNVARAVLSGAADVGGTYCVFENANPTANLLRAGFFDVSPNQQGRVLLATSAIPSDLIVASERVSSEIRRRLADALVGLRADAMAMAPVHEVLGADEFQTCDETVLAPLREQIQVGRQLGLWEERDDSPRDSFRLP